MRDLVGKMDVSYDYSSLQIQLPSNLSKMICDWGLRNIPEEDLHNDGEDTKGREDDIHVTLFYGLKSSDPGQVQKLLKNVAPFNVRLGLVTLFLDKDDYDVVKIDVESPELYELHYAIGDQLENANKYPTYNPHCTVAYVKKGTGRIYMADDEFRGQEFMVNNIVFSASDDGGKIQIKLKS